MGICLDLLSVEAVLIEEFVKQPQHLEKFLCEPLPKTDKIYQASLEKSWHVLHVVLTGDPELNGTALSNSILGGTLININLGYGKPRYHTAASALTIHNAISVTNLKDKIAKHSAVLQSDIKVYKHKGEVIDSVLVEPYFKELASVYKHASENGNGILIAAV